MPVTDGVSSGAIVVQDGQQRKSQFDAVGIDPNAKNDVANDRLRYQTSLYTVVVNETKELRLQCAYHGNPNKLRTPVKWYYYFNFFLINCIREGPSKINTNTRVVEKLHESFDGCYDS